MEQENTQNLPAANACSTCPNNKINTHFTLSVITLILSCFTGLWTIPLALASLILSLRTQDLIQAARWDEAKNTARWACFCGWVTILAALLPVILIIFFGGAMLTFLIALLAAA